MSRPGPGAPAPGHRPARPVASMDLLREVMTQTVDPDYALVAHRRDSVRSRGRWRPVAASVVIVLGLLVSAAAVQRVRAAPQLEADRAALVTQVQQLRESIAKTQALTAAVRADVGAIQGTVATGTERNDLLGASLVAARVLSGTVPVTGPGLRIVVDDSPDAGGRAEGQVLDTDLQVLVNGLWESGAEAIAINGHRLGPLSSIRVAGKAITVNFRSLSSPYVVEAIGDPATLQARFIDTAAGQTWLDLQTNFGLVFRPTEHEQLSLPAIPEPRLASVQPLGELP